MRDNDLNEYVLTYSWLNFGNWIVKKVEISKKGYYEHTDRRRTGSLESGVQGKSLSGRTGRLCLIVGSVRIKLRDEL